MQLHPSGCAQSHGPIGDRAADRQTHLPIAAFGHLPTTACDMIGAIREACPSNQKHTDTGHHADAAGRSIASHTQAAFHLGMLISTHCAAVK